MKTCKKCLTEQPITNFNSNKQNSDNLQTKCKKCIAELKKGYRSSEAQRAKSKAYAMWYKYGISWDEYTEFIKDGCEACGSLKNLSIDHDHNCCPGTKTCGKCLRGALCRGCNTLEGFVRANPASLNGVIAYMKKHGTI